MSAQLDVLLQEQQKLQETLAAKVNVGDMGLEAETCTTDNRATQHGPRLLRAETWHLAAVGCAGQSTNVASMAQGNYMRQRDVRITSLLSSVCGLCTCVCLSLQEAEKQRMLAERAAQQEVCVHDAARAICNPSADVDLEVATNNKQP